MARSKSSGRTLDLTSLPLYGALILRLALGASMIHHGYSKVIPDGAMDHYAHYIVSLGLPYWMGYVSALTEFAGGILVLLGLLTRIAGTLIALNMLVALFLVGIHSGAATVELIGLEFALAAALVCF